ncbi:hypothetical protein CAP35_06630, partial [Chitinophagaceae bacterium IBVUCB1]
MKKSFALFPIFIFLFVLHKQRCYAQFYQLTHASGTQGYGGVSNVTAQGVGTNPGIAINALCSNVVVYINGGSPSGVNNGYKFTFSRAATRIRVHSYMLQFGDSLFFYINGNLFPITSANLSVPAGICNGNVAPVMAVPNGGITSTFSGPGCGYTAYFNAQVDIFPTYPIDTFMTWGTSGACAGNGSQIFFASDTLVYVKKPFSITSVCAGDTIRLPYIVSNRFNNGNVFTAQLSNASGSFAAPVNIGSRTDTTGDTIVCVIPRTTAGGTGYRIRIVS